MLQQRKVRTGAMAGVEKGRELLEDELAVICGGRANASSPGGMGFGDSSGFPPLTNVFNPQDASANSGARDNTLPGLSKAPGLSSLGMLAGLTSGLLGRIV
jgi:hypothetical protein